MKIKAEDVQSRNGDIYPVHLTIMIADQDVFDNSSCRDLPAGYSVTAEVLNDVHQYCILSCSLPTSLRIETSEQV